MKEEISNEDNKCKLIIIGNKTDDEVYLKPILQRISRYDCVYIQTFPYQDRLTKIQEYYLQLSRLGVKEVEKREKIKIQSNKDSKKYVDVILIKWEVIPRLMQYRETLEKEEY